MAFCGDEDGATSIEYALIAALIALGLVAALIALGGSIDALFQTVADLFP
jgi:pilus assembly protein Flp/PilA